MFLFTTPRTQTGPQQGAAGARGAAVTGATATGAQATVPNGLGPVLMAASQATGTSFDYLTQTAKRESNFDPAAKARNSSATGLFQFIEQTWLGLVKTDGARFGLGAAADAIVRDRNGRYAVEDGATRERILALRENPAVAANLAGVFTQKNRAVLKQATGRDPSAGELYIAHFLGAQGASDLIALATRQPDSAAAASFSDAAAANRSIFYDRQGRARPAREVYAQLMAQHTGQPVVPVDPPVAVAQVAETKPVALGPRAFHGLFNSANGSASGQNARRAWAVVAQQRQNSGQTGFFPRDLTDPGLPEAQPVSGAAATNGNDSAKISRQRSGTT